MTETASNTMLIRWLLGVVGLIFVGVLGFIASSFSGELKELQNSNHTSKERLGVVETIVDNIRDDVQEIKGSVKETQEQVDKIDENIGELKTLIMNQELNRMRESRRRRATTGPHETQ